MFIIPLNILTSAKFVGQVLQNIFPNAIKTVMTQWKVSKLSPFCLLTIIWSAYDQAFQSGAFKSVPGNNLVFVVFVSIALFFLWLVLAFFTARLWLPRKDVVAVCYCVPAKTPAMGVPLIQTIYYGLKPIQESKLQIPIVIFQGLQIAGGSLLLGTFRWWVDRKEKPHRDEDDGDNQRDGEA
jgi:solute carrier family 10 (sodium/bile acid cotransporter), member 7